MMKPLFLKGSGFPSLHSGRSYCNPVDTARAVRDIASDLPKTRVPEKLTQRSGKTVWATTESSVFCKKACSFLAGVISTYFIISNPLRPRFYSLLCPDISERIFHP